jgi:parallel beta-helix repeat protein
MTVFAGGTPRTTSDAIDFDQGNNSLVERVKITGSRARAIVFDGKNAGWTSAGNVVRDCVIDGVPGDGVEFLASTDNLVEGCTITNTGRNGIQAAKSSPLADQPNKKANNNTIRNNVIDNAGIDGINVTSSDGNRILGNRVTNSSDDVAAADGIRVGSADSISCDDNVVDGNVALDNQATKTQRYGFNIASSLCNRTVVGGSNDFSGNRVRAVNDLGTGTIYGGDALPPAAPSTLAATGVYKTQIDLSWSAATDNVGVTAYELWRDGSLLTTLGVQTSYSDTSVAAGSAHSYQMRARDAAGNVSSFSDSAQATTPTSGLLFHDGFETGDLSKWTSVSGLAVAQNEVFGGSWAARATGANTPAYAQRVLSLGENNLYWQVHFKVLGQSTNANLLRFRTAGNASLLTAFVSSTDKIGYRNDVTGVSTTSTAPAARGAWHALQVHVTIDGAASQTDVWLDGTKIDALSKSEDLGSSPVGRLELGDSAANHTFDVAFDDADYDREYMADTASPSTPGALAATAKSGFEIDLSWGASFDESGVAAYEVYRDGELLDSVSGSATSYADATVSPLTSYSYKVRAKDAAGNVSPFGNVVSLTSGDAFVDDFESGDLSRWTTVAGLTLQQAIVDRGQWAAQAASDGSAGSSAQVRLGSSIGELYYRARFRISSQGTNSLSLLRFRTAQNAALASAFVTSLGKLAYRNDANSTFTVSTQQVSQGIWHEIQMHLVAAGASSQVELWLDGVKVLTQADSLAEGSIGRLELGDPGANRSFDVAFDNVVADPIFIADTAAPTAPANLRSTSVSASEVDLAWDAANDDVGVTTYRVKRDGAPIADVDGSTFSYADRGLADGTSYVYTVTARDAIGHESGPSNQLQVTTTDATKPSAPTGLAATAVAGQNRVELSWRQATDNIAVTGYRIYRDGARIGSVEGAASTSYADPTVLPSRTYAYTVTALDAAGNESDPSAPATVTSSDTVPPSAPAGLTAAPVSDIQINLGWTAASDNVAVTGYRIYRDGSALPVATVGGSTTTFADSGRAADATYTYTVRAVDAAGNESPASNAAAATTYLFADGFESGNISRWTGSTNFTVQSGNTFAGSWAGEAQSNGNKGVVSYAYKQLSATRVEIYYQLRFKLLSNKKDTATLLRLDTASGTSLLSLFYDMKKQLGYQTAAGQRTSATVLAVGSWYEARVHLVVKGTASQVEVWLNGTKITALSRTESLGTAPVGRIEVGESMSGPSYDIAYDEVLVKKTP